MADVFALAGNVGGLMALVLVIAFVVVPRAIDAWRSRNRDAAEVAKVAEREVTARHRIDAEGHALAADLIRERAEDHRACREEVAELRVTVDDCQRKHAESEARVTATEAVVAELRSVVSWMRRELAELRRDSERPNPEPAE